MSPAPADAPDDGLARLAQLGRGEIEGFRRALESRGVRAFVLPPRECDGPT